MANHQSASEQLGSTPNALQSENPDQIEIEEEWWHEADVRLDPEPPPERSLSRQQFGAQDVRWGDDNVTPDYRHLDASFGDQEFDFTVADLELIIRANRFEPTREQERILFGLRGALLVEGSNSSGPSLKLKLTRPNHRDFRCTIGVYDTAAARLSGFMASTVPWYSYIHDYYQRGGGDPKTNLLPTGCYPYFVGSHGQHQIPGCFRLGRGLGDPQQERVAVLRTFQDVTYDTGDNFDPSIPHDNLHPSFGTRTFRSRGCQTVRGSYGSGHSGDWASFRQAVGLGDRGDNGRRFDYVLVTGVEAAIASKLRHNEPIPNPNAVLEKLTRLRHGSSGDLVKSLQGKLRLDATGQFGANEVKALAVLQAQKFGFADGVYSPEMDTRLDFKIFGSAPAVIAPQTRQISPASQRVALVVGCGGYINAPQLLNPPNDATAVAGRLSKLGFAVTVLTDVRKETLLQAIDQFSDALSRSEVGFIFFAGHGVQMDGENYLLPIDSKVDGEAQFRGSSVPLSYILEPIKNLQKAGIVFLDCCRDNPFGGRAQFRSLYRGLAKIDAPFGTFIAFSTAPGATARDGLPGSENSPFVVALIERIEKEDQRISDLMIEVRQAVFRATDGQQLPWENSSLLTPFAFNQKKADLGAPEDQATAAKEREEQYWQLSSTSNNEALIESFITQYPYSRLRSLADEKLASLRRRRARKKMFAGAFALTVVLALIFAAPWVYRTYQEEEAIRKEASRTDARGAIEAFSAVDIAYDKTKGHKTSPYTTPLVEKLRQKNKSLVEALTNVHQSVVENTSDTGDYPVGPQRPFLSASMNRQIYLWRQPPSRIKKVILIAAGDAGPSEWQLAAPVHDLDAVASLLKAAGYGHDDMTALNNPTRDEIRSEIVRVLAAVKSMPPNSVDGPATKAVPPLPRLGGVDESAIFVGRENAFVLIYFTGHGFSWEGKKYLVPRIGTKQLRNEESVAKLSIELDWLRATLGESSAAYALVLDTHFPPLSKRLFEKDGN